MVNVEKAKDLIWRYEACRDLSIREFKCRLKTVADKSQTRATRAWALESASGWYENIRMYKALLADLTKLLERVVDNIG